MMAQFMADHPEARASSANSGAFPNRSATQDLMLLSDCNGAEGGFEGEDQSSGVRGRSFTHEGAEGFQQDEVISLDAFPGPVPHSPHYTARRGDADGGPADKRASTASVIVVARGAEGGGRVRASTTSGVRSKAVDAGADSTDVVATHGGMSVPVLAPPPTAPAPITRAQAGLSSRSRRPNVRTRATTADARLVTKRVLQVDRHMTRARGDTVDLVAEEALPSAAVAEQRARDELKRDWQAALSTVADPANRDRADRARYKTVLPVEPDACLYVARLSDDDSVAPQRVPLSDIRVTDAPLPHDGGRGAGIGSGRNKQVLLWWEKRRPGSPRGRARSRGGGNGNGGKAPEAICLAKMYEIEWMEIVLQLRLAAADLDEERAAGHGDAGALQVAEKQQGAGRLAVLPEEEVSDPRTPPALALTNGAADEEEAKRKAQEEKEKEHLELLRHLHPNKFEWVNIEHADPSYHEPGTSPTKEDDPKEEGHGEAGAEAGAEAAEAAEARKAELEAEPTSVHEPMTPAEWAALAEAEAEFYGEKGREAARAARAAKVVDEWRKEYDELAAKREAAASAAAAAITTLNVTTLPFPTSTVVTTHSSVGLEGAGVGYGDEYVVFRGDTGEQLTLHNRPPEFPAAPRRPSPRGGRRPRPSAAAMGGAVESPREPSPSRTSPTRREAGRTDGDRLLLTNGPSADSTGGGGGGEGGQGNSRGDRHPSLRAELFAKAEAMFEANLEREREEARARAAALGGQQTLSKKPLVAPRPFHDAESARQPPQLQNAAEERMPWQEGLEQQQHRPYEAVGTGTGELREYRRFRGEIFEKSLVVPDKTRENEDFHFQPRPQPQPQPPTKSSQSQGHASQALQSDAPSETHKTVKPRGKLNNPQDAGACMLAFLQPNLNAHNLNPHPTQPHTPTSTLIRTLARDETTHAHGVARDATRVLTIPTLANPNVAYYMSVGGTDEQGTQEPAVVVYDTPRRKGPVIPPAKIPPAKGPRMPYR